MRILLGLLQIAAEDLLAADEDLNRGTGDRDGDRLTSFRRQLQFEATESDVAAADVGAVDETSATRPLRAASPCPSTEKLVRLAETSYLPFPLAAAGAAAVRTRVAFRMSVGLLLRVQGPESGRDRRAEKQRCGSGCT